jgi:uncharacterized protein (DUF58 family)
MSVSSDFLDPTVLSQLMGWPLYARQPMLGSVSGRHASPIRGSSLEFAEYRKYVPGDDLRRLDWRAWGRSDRFYIKEFEADTNLRLCLIVDTSGSMNFTAEDSLSKLEYARQLSGYLSYLAIQQGDAVGLYCAGKSFHKEIPPRRNPAHLSILMENLSVMKAEGETGLPEALHEAAEKIPQRALIVIISDLFIKPEILNDCFQHLRFRRHDVAIFHLLSKAEIEFTFDRPTRFVDLEEDTSVLADPTVISQQYHKALQNYLSNIDTIVQSTGADYHRIVLPREPGEVLADFLIRRTPKKASR